MENSQKLDAISQSQNEGEENMEGNILRIPEGLETWDSYIPSKTTLQPAPPVSPPDIIQWFLSFPSVPLNLRKQFMAFWEMLPLGNYDERDIRKLEVKFNGWILDFLMSIPDVEWNSVFRFRGQGIGEADLEMDLNTLFSTLRIIFYIQLTRGKGGFTARLMGGHPLKEEKEKKKKWSLF